MTIHNYSIGTHDKLGSIIDKGVSPKGEKTFFIALGSRSCPACTQLYQTMYKYNNLGKGKTAQDGFIPFWTTDTDLEAEAAQQFAYEYILDSKWVGWDVNGKNGTFSRLSDIATPTIFFIKDGKLEEIILGTTIDVDKVINYVKRKI